MAINRFFSKTHNILIKLSGTSLLLFLGSQVLAQADTDPCIKIHKTKSLLDAKHVKPVRIEAPERREILALYINDLDASNLFFTTEKLEMLQQTAADEGLCAAFKKSQQFFMSAIDKYDSITTSYLSKSVADLKGAKITVNRSLNNHLRKSDKDYEAFVQQSLKHRILLAAWDKFTADSTLAKKMTPELESELREKLAEEEKEYVTRKRSDKNKVQNILLNSFLNAIALRFDPHSNFFTLDEKMDLEKELSDNVMIFGIQYIENKQSEIEITAITPGSSAWISDQVDEGDIIEEIEFRKGNKESLKNKGSAYLSSILRDDKLIELTFHLRKKSGLIQKVKLVKSKVENKENSFIGYVLSDGKHKMGYISLPSFYTDYESDSHLGCANDVAKEIILLKKDSIQGLILDLRNNGGGSLWEALELSGLFIDEGPLSVYQAATGKPTLLKDPKRGTVYDGPLIVLVNNSSASASEFFAGCMQDYNRALIFGDVSYGKGSSQSVYPLDSNDYFGLNGFMKITNGKFYHVSGRSNQEKGIIPDVLAHDIYSDIQYFKEYKQLYHLPNDSTAKKVTYTKQGVVFPSQVLENSQKRIASAAHFTLLQQKAIQLQNRVEKDLEIPLEFEKFIAFQQQAEKFWDEIYKYPEINGDFSISNHSYAQKLLSFQGNERKQNDEIIADLKKDAFIYESCLILRDFFTFVK